ncbi:MAG TPA: asparagine synthase, partial [Methanotrichaceae archaeon]|nr:asparagine synthase [Methanotrichaceae archaeon]
MKGWIELEGRRLSQADLEDILSENPSHASNFGGEFFLLWDDCMAKDRFGIIPGDCPAGTVVCGGEE